MRVCPATCISKWTLETEKVKLSIKFEKLKDQQSIDTPSEYNRCAFTSITETLGLLKDLKMDKGKMVFKLEKSKVNGGKTYTTSIFT